MVNGISANRYRIAELGEAEREIGYAPTDDTWAWLVTELRMNVSGSQPVSAGRARPQSQCSLWSFSVAPNAKKP